MGALFMEHNNKLVEVANLACSMSNNVDGIKMVRFAAAQIKNFGPQVLSQSCDVFGIKNIGKTIQSAFDSKNSL
jgi:hypothetical protein